MTRTSLPLRSAGFTLMELIITMTIIALLAAVAVPMYTQQLAAGRRAEAKAALLKAANTMERAFTANNVYPATLAAAGINAFSGDNAASSHYDLALLSTATTFTLTATPHIADAVCGTFSLNHLGVRTYTGTGTPAQCWGAQVVGS